MSAISTTETTVRPVPQLIAHEITVPRQTKRWVDWVMTTDHKQIGIMYLVRRSSSSCSAASRRC